MDLATLMYLYSTGKKYRSHTGKNRLTLRPKDVLQSPLDTIKQYIKSEDEEGSMHDPNGQVFLLQYKFLKNLNKIINQSELNRSAIKLKAIELGSIWNWKHCIDQKPYTLGYIDVAKFLMYSVPGFQLLKIDPLWRCTPKFQLEIWTVTAWIFSESTATSISFPIQISKSIFSQTKANTVEQMHENYGLWHNLSTFGQIRA